MGSSAEDPNKGCGIDAAVGGLVWVCRRNGSWWPGRIIDRDELPEGSIPTTRPGVPVKLLGRDDASVDYYNLEKSKRVKAFRCGEFDDCIEKAKEALASSSAHLYKRPTKYARREDAILEALELESVRLGVECPNLSSKSDTQQGDDHRDDESSVSEECEDDNGSEDDDSESTPELSRSGVSFEEQDHVASGKKEPKGWSTMYDSDDDGSDGVKRMKGIEDLGMGVESKQKRKASSKGSKGHEVLKRKSRSLPLTKVLECTAVVPLPVVCKDSSSPTGSNVTGVVESHDSRKKNSAVINTSDSTDVSCENVTSAAASVDVANASLKPLMQRSPDDETLRSLFDVPATSAKKNNAGLANIVSGSSQLPAALTLSSQSSHVETMSLGNEEPNDSNSTSSGTVNVHTISHKSEWQLKGKRNSRSRKTEIDDVTDNNWGDRVKSRPIADIQFGEFGGWSVNAHRREWCNTKLSNAEVPATQRPSGEVSATQRLLPYRHSRFTLNPKYESSEFSLRHHVTESGLYDVNIEVQTNRRPQQVPYISLMSKLTRRPIVGHPVEIEVLADGFCDGLLNIPECDSSGSSEFDYSVSDVSSFEGVKALKSNGKPPIKRGPRGPYRPRNALKKKITAKSKKNGNTGLLSKKMRKLSSLTGLNKKSEERKLIVEKVKRPVISCVPLKVVFSRINADLSNSMRFPAPRMTSTSVM